jgi:hypothetical protein
MKTDAIKSIRDKFQEAHALRSDTSALFRELREQYRDKIAAISSNPALSAYGKQQERQKVAAQYEKELMRLSKQVFDAYKKTIKEAKEQAEKILLASIPKTDEKKRKFFQQQAEELAAKVLFATNPQTAKDALAQLVKAANEPELASSVKERFMQLSQHAINLCAPAEQMQMRKELGELYEHLSQNSLTQEAREARQLVEQADAMLGVRLFSPIVEQAAYEISPQASRYLNDPDAYFEKFGADGQ